MNEKREDIRFNTRELIGLFVLLVVVSSLIFGLGVYVGKGMSETEALIHIKEKLKEQQIVQSPDAIENVMEIGAIQSDKPEEITEVVKRDDAPVVLAEENVSPQKKQVAEKKEVNVGVDREKVRDDLLIDELLKIENLPYKTDVAKIFKDNAPIFSILVQTSSDRNVAENLVKVLSKKVDGVHMDVAPASPVDPTEQYRVLIGMYHSIGQAKSIAAALQLNDEIGTFSIKRMD